MFGLLRPHKRLVGPEDWRDYASAYCNLCASLSHRYGLTSRLLVVHDVATADWLLSGAAQARRPFPTCNCAKGGTRSVPPALRTDERQSLLAAVSAYTVGVKVQDDLADGGGWKARLAHTLYRDTFARARRDLAQDGFDVAAFEAALVEQQELERRGETDLGGASGPSGRAFGLVARHLAERHGGAGPEDAYALGERIGRSVFLVDAYQDFGHDLAAGAYNPLRCAGGGAAPLEPGRAREVLGVVDGLLDEAQAICARMSERVAVRWRAARASLTHRMSHGDGPPPETDITRQGFIDDPPVPGETPEEEEARRRRRRGRKRKEGRPCGVSGCCDDDWLTTLICCDVGGEGACCCLELLSCW